jgi:hypothetical protein
VDGAGSGFDNPGGGPLLKLDPLGTPPFLDDCKGLFQAFGLDMELDDDEGLFLMKLGSKIKVRTWIVKMEEDFMDIL